MTDRGKLQAEALLGAADNGDVIWSGSPRSMFQPPPTASDTSEPSGPTTGSGLRVRVTLQAGR